MQVSRQPKSVSNETTFEEDTTDPTLLAEHIARLAQRVSERLQRRSLAGRTVVLKLTYRNFQHVTRRTTLKSPTSDAAIIAAEARTLLGRSAAASRFARFPNRNRNKSLLSPLIRLSLFRVSTSTFHFA